VLAARCPAGQRDRDDHERDDPDRQVDVEHPAPGQAVGEEPAEQRPDDARDAEDRAEGALVLAPLAGRHDVGHDRLGQHYQAAAAQPLQGAERDQLDHAVRQAAQRRADQEDHDRRLEQPLAAVLVAELAPQRRRCRRGEQVGGHYPGQMAQAAEVADDRGQRGRDDGLVERGEQDREHQRRVNNQQPAAGLDGRRRGLRFRRHAGNLPPAGRFVPSRARVG
jgi:hypothetical protein